MASHLDALIAAPGPKKLLSLDGGGIRGLIAIEILSRMERLLRERFGRRDMVLSDYFDYVGGTSTGAIAATSIALGLPTDEIRELYLTGAKAMFDPSNLLLRLGRRFGHNALAAKLLNGIGAMTSSSFFTPKALTQKIKESVGKDGDVEATLGSTKLRTLLLIVMRNASTDSPWPISNNPRAKFNGRDVLGCNLDLPLWQLVRASTAAPVFFPPEVIDVGGQQFVFVDGGVTVYNNPAFLLFLMATLPPYNVCWPAGEDKLLLVSVGTGISESVNLKMRAGDMNLLYNVQSLPTALILASTVEQDLLCRVFGRTRAGAELDSEIGDLIGNQAPLAQKLFTYARYNVDLSRQGLDRLGLNAVTEEAVQPFGADHLEELVLVGKTVAERCVSAKDFDGF